MATLIIAGGKPPVAEEKPGMMKMMPGKKFRGIGGSYSSDEPEEETETAPESSAGVEEARMFVDALKSGKATRVLETFKALLQSCTEAEDE